MLNKFSILFLLVIIILVFLGSCSNDSINVKMNDDVSLYLEVHSEFADPGVSIPDGFTVTSVNNINMNKIGVYEISYRVLDNEGVVFKEMIRIINVVDSTPPEIVLTEKCIIHLGVHNDIQNCYEISDNYYSEDSLIVTSNIENVNPNYLPGVYTIELTAEDPSGNTSIVETEVEIILDYFYIINHLEQYGAEISSITYSDSGGPYQKPSYWINFWNGDRVNISNEGDFYFVMRHNANIGSGFVFFSGEFADMKDTIISISIKRSTSSESSWLRLYNFDASIEYEELDLSESTFINDGNINYENALITFNEQGLIAINQLIYIYEDILGLGFNN